jgi:hypothetical protein
MAVPTEKRIINAARAIRFIVASHSRVHVIHLNMRHLHLQGIASARRFRADEVPLRRRQRTDSHWVLPSGTISA